MRFIVKILLLSIVLIIGGCSQNSDASQEITVSAAASLKDALTDIKDLYINENQAEIHLNFASSGTLRMQIEQGAPTDIFISASEGHFNRLLEQDLIDSAHHQVLLKNKMVLISPAGNTSIKSVGDLVKPEVKRVAIGIPESVPAGKYGKETLMHYGIWDQVEAKLVPTKDVRQVLTYVETGNVDAGFVYKTDAALSDKIKLVEVIEEKAHDPIVYPMGIIKNSSDNTTAKAFYEFLQSGQAKAIFEKYGFEVMD